MSEFNPEIPSQPADYKKEEDPVSVAIDFLLDELNQLNPEDEDYEEDRKFLLAELKKIRDRKSGMIDETDLMQHIIKLMEEKLPQSDEELRKDLLDRVRKKLEAEIAAEKPWRDIEEAKRQREETKMIANLQKQMDEIRAEAEKTGKSKNEVMLERMVDKIAETDNRAREVIVEEVKTLLKSMGISIDKNED